MQGHRLTLGTIACEQEHKPHIRMHPVVETHDEGKLSRFILGIETDVHRRVQEETEEEQTMKPGDALILDGKIHLVVAVGKTISIQAPDGVITEFSREKLMAFLCGPPTSSMADEEAMIRAIQKIEDFKRKSDPYQDPWGTPRYYDHIRRDQTPFEQREYERRIREYVDAMKGKYPKW